MREFRSQILFLSCEIEMFDWLVYSRTFSSIDSRTGEARAIEIPSRIVTFPGTKFRFRSSRTDNQKNTIIKMTHLSLKCAHVILLLPIRREGQSKLRCQSNIRIQKIIEERKKDRLVMCVCVLISFVGEIAIVFSHHFLFDKKIDECEFFRNQRNQQQQRNGIVFVLDIA